MGAASTIPEGVKAQLDDVDAAKRTVVLFHGMAGCALENRISRPDFLGGGKCPDTFHLAWVSPHRLAWDIERTVDTLTMRYNEETGALNDLDGVHVRTVHGLKGIDKLTLDETLLGQGEFPLFHHMIERFKDDFNMTSLNYDFRKWGCRAYAAEYLEMFKASIEGLVKKLGATVDLCAHSLGANVVLYCLAMMEEQWVKFHVRQLFLLGPAMAGSPSTLGVFAGGPLKPVHNTYPIPKIIDSLLARATSTWGGMTALLPQPVGAVDPWPEDMVLVSTPTRKYGPGDMEQFLNDVMACKPSFTDVGPKIFSSARHLAEKQATPPVQTHVIYGAGKDTMSELKYSNEDLLAWPAIAKSVLGDGTITAESVEKVGEAWKKENEQVFMHKAPKDCGHIGIAGDAEVLELIHKIITEGHDAADRPSSAAGRGGVLSAIKTKFF